jgi:hypothetical protein
MARKQMTDDAALSIHASFLESVASPRVKDLVADAVEFSLDAITDDEVLKQVPFVKVALALKGVGKRFSQRKTYRFVAALNNIPREERERFVRNLRADPRRAQKVVESFAVWLDRLDDEDKARLLARVFELYALGEIDFERSARFAGVIDRGHLPYLLAISDGSMTQEVQSHLLALGLLTVRGGDVARQVARDVAPRNIEEIKFELNADGRTFHNYVMLELPVTPRVTHHVQTS